MHKIVGAPSVIVIGAGIAGLAAVRRLQEAGVSLLVVEARSRIGGRTWTARDWGVPVELGASWVHGNTTADCFPDRPKGMHKANYNRLRQQASLVEGELLSAVTQRLRSRRAGR